MHVTTPHLGITRDSCLPEGQGSKVKRRSFRISADRTNRQSAVEDPSNTRGQQIDSHRLLSSEDLTVHAPIYLYFLQVFLDFFSCTSFVSSSPGGAETDARLSRLNFPFSCPFEILARRDSILRMCSALFVKLLRDTLLVLHCAGFDPLDPRFCWMHHSCVPPPDNYTVIT